MMTVSAELRLISLPAFLWEMHTHAPTSHIHKLRLMTSRYSQSIYNTCLAHVTFILLIHSLVCVNIHKANGVCMKMHLALYKRRCSADYDYSGTQQLPPIRIRSI